MLSEPLRSLPYLVHTCRELGLMLRGVKPLAIFSDLEGGFPDAMVRYLRLFDRHIVSGRFRRHDRVQPVSGEMRIHRIYFTLPEEEWRVQALIDLFARPEPWSQASEREFGRLLGYTEWENDIWEDRFPFRPIGPS